ncbi:hypothetical protein VNI00_019382, partial [Paramarasmius palmivorus]
IEAIDGSSSATTSQGLTSPPTQHDPQPTGAERSSRLAIIPGTILGGLAVISVVVAILYLRRRAGRKPKQTVILEIDDTALPIPTSIAYVLSKRSVSFFRRGRFGTSHTEGSFSPQSESDAPPPPYSSNK